MAEWLMNSGLMAVGASIGYALARARVARRLPPDHIFVTRGDGKGGEYLMRMDANGDTYLMRALKGR